MTRWALLALLFAPAPSFADATPPERGAPLRVTLARVLDRECRRAYADKPGCALLAERIRSGEARLERADGGWSARDVDGDTAIRTATFHRDGAAWRADYQNLPVRK